MHAYVADPIGGELSGGFLIKHLPDRSSQFRDLVPDDAPDRRAEAVALSVQLVPHDLVMDTEVGVEHAINIVPGKTLPEERECGLRVLPTVPSTSMERL